MPFPALPYKIFFIKLAAEFSKRYSMDQLKMRLEQLLQLPENSKCADCFESFPTWASTNWGVFICAQCAGVHRSLGVEHSFVLSCRLDEWTNEQVEHMASKGNEKMNKDLEYCVPKTIEVPYEKYTDRDTREKYIRAKYVDLLFKKLENRSPSPPKRVYRKVSRTSTSSASSLREAAMVEFIGIVNVKLVEGRNLIVKDIVSSDPYCVLTVGLQTRKSTIKKSSLNPLYNEEFAFSWDGKDELKIEIFDHDDLSKDDHMGVISLDLDFLKKNKDKLFESWHQVTHRKHRDRQQGELLLELSFFPIE